MIDLYAQIQEHIDGAGRFIMGVFPTKEHPGPHFQYTIGNHTKNLPEVLCIGVNAGSLMNDWSEMMIELGREFRNGELVDVGGKFPCMAIQCDRRAQKEYTFQATYFFEHDDYRVTQMLVPDEKGRFGPRASKPYRDVPILGVMP